MHQVVMKMNVMSPVIFNIAGVDALHVSGRQQYRCRKWQGDGSPVGVLGNDMIQDGYDVNLGDPLSSSVRFSLEYVKTSQQRRGLTDDSMEVGLIGSTRSVGKPRTRQQAKYSPSWGSGQQWCNGFRDSLPDTRRLD
jgi:hypothetical protein